MTGDEARAQLEEARLELGGLRAAVAHLEPLVNAHCHRADVMRARALWLAEQLAQCNSLGLTASEWFGASADHAPS